MAGDEQSLNDLFAALRASSSPHQASGATGSGAPQQLHQPQQRAGSAANPTSQQQHHHRQPPPAHLQSGSTGTSPAPASTAAAPPPPTTQETDRTANLLNLLRFSPSAPSPSAASNNTAAAPATQNIHGRGVSASDLVASFMGQPREASPAQPPAAATTSNPANPQDYLLQLLNRTQQQQQSVAKSPPAASPVAAIPGADVNTPPAPRPGSKDQTPRVARDATPRDSPTPGSNVLKSQENTLGEHSAGKKASSKPNGGEAPLFTYVNPFEQLAASSPRNASRSGNATPRKETPPAVRRAQDVGKSELKQGNHAVDQTQPSTSEEALPERVKNRGPPSAPLEDLGAPTTDPSTVAEALNEVSEKVSRQADFALAQAEEESQKNTKEAQNPTTKSNSQQNLATKDAKKALHGSQNLRSEALLAQDMATRAEDAPEVAPGGHGSADDEKSSANGEDGAVVPVYNFVMKPFVSIVFQQTKVPERQFRQDCITDIARLKKEFDQIDRTLATATTEYIIYSLPKSGGIRVIRQEDGADRQVFKETKDHVFNVALSSAPLGKSSYDLETAIATATSGTVYWTALHHNKDNIESPDLQQHSLIFPPVSANDEHAAGGQLKTRAKRSSRHPEIFAIGRGKLIQVIFPLHAATSSFVNEKRVVDTDSYFKDRSLKINTGKAGKDFTFSEDDTVIATLDKAGRLRFWDVRELVHETNSEPSVLSPVEIRTPILTLSTSSPPEKTWPTSVLFVDKGRPYTKGIALRYVIVGMKQNHTLQLWDLAIGKVIQEVHFLHSKESDAICSVCYHPASGIIVVGHPTRNSIYFIHLSAPKYNLPGMSQARYLTRIADKDSSLPKLESTAIMSGMREYSFASKGQLRSIDLLPISNDTFPDKDESGLFELYVMHSKGVTMLTIHREDLGWSDDMKVINPVSAEKEGMIQIKELVQPPTAIVSENSSVNGDAAPPPMPTKKASTALAKVADKASAAENDSTEKGPGASTNDKPDKRKKKKGAAKEEDAVVPPPAPVAPSSYATAAAKSVERPSPRKRASELSERTVRPESDPITLDVSTDFIDKELKKIETNVAEEFRKTFDHQLGILYKRINEDKQIRDAQHGADREALLRMISKHLGSNLEGALKKIVSESMETQLLPAFREIVSSALQKEISGSLNQNIQGAISKELNQSIPKALSKSLQNADVLNQLGTSISHRISEAAHNSMKAAAGSSKGAQHSNEIETRIHDNVRQLLQQQEQDRANISQLHTTVETLISTVQSMAAAQRELTGEIARLQGPSADVSRGSPRTERSKQLSTDSKATAPSSSGDSAELRAIKELMQEGAVEEATVKWLQSPNQADIFDSFFVNLDPRYLGQCSPLVTLSVAVAVTASLANHVHQKLTWLDVILSSINYQDTDIKDVAPRIMTVLYKRLEAYYVQLSHQTPNSPQLARLGTIVQKIRGFGQ